MRVNPLSAKSLNELNIYLISSFGKVDLILSNPIDLRYLRPSKTLSNVPCPVIVFLFLSYNSFIPSIDVVIKRIL